MTVAVAEYLGQRVDVDEPDIVPVERTLKPLVPCPFRFGHCDKARKGHHPICSVRKSDGTLWIVCEHRACSTTKSQLNPGTRERVNPAPLAEHQKQFLRLIATELYGDNLDLEEVGVAREKNIPVEGGDSYHADYIMVATRTQAVENNFIVEIQGGGETTNTGALTGHVQAWEDDANPTNEQLRSQVPKVGTLETNAWRRQQEQFLVKGNVVSQTGGRIVFVVGGLLYDYLHSRIQRGNLRDLKGAYWTLALLALKEKNLANPQPGSIELELDTERQLYTNYNTFVRTLTDQGAPCPDLFEGDFASII